jgi:glutathione peroxidase
MKNVGLLGFLFSAMLLAAATMPNLYEIPLKDIHDKDAPLKNYKGKVLLLVNVASKCGYTPQYKGLESLYKQFKDQGLVVVGIPSNDFGGQEPGTPEEIQAFCEKNYGVTFPLMSKVKVKGPEKHALYGALTGENSPFPGEVKWNFGKFLVGRDGKIIARYDSKVAPDSPELIKAVENALAAK